MWFSKKQLHYYSTLHGCTLSVCMKRNNCSCDCIFFIPLRAICNTAARETGTVCTRAPSRAPHLVCREVAPLACNWFSSQSLMQCKVSVTVCRGTCAFVVVRYLSCVQLCKVGHIQGQQRVSVYLEKLRVYCVNTTRPLVCNLTFLLNHVFISMIKINIL